MTKPKPKSAPPPESPADAAPTRDASALRVQETAPDPAPSSASLVEPHKAAEAAAAAIPDDATAHDLMPWTPVLRERYSSPEITAPAGWRVTPLSDFMLAGEPCVMGVPLTSDRVMLLDAHVLRRMYAARYVHIALVDAPRLDHIAAQVASTGVETTPQGVIGDAGR
jgi:hypothetical protein